MQFKEFKTESSEDPLYLRRGVSKARNIGIVSPIERAFCLCSTLWPHVTKKRPERIKVVPIRLPNNAQQSKSETSEQRDYCRIKGMYKSPVCTIVYHK